jgi:Reverse transcriptase (RNA-dependent DNA polymerase)
MDTMVPKQAGFFGKPFNASRGFRQGDIISPIIFNMVADAVIRECEHQFIHGSMEQINLVKKLFYADDGALLREDPKEVQYMLDLFTSTFT